MESFTLISKSKKLSLILNTSFLFLFSFHLTTTLLTLPSTPITFLNPHQTNNDGCTALHSYTDFESKCKYVQSYIACRPKGYINYLKIFYCICGGKPLLGYALLLLWFIILIYTMGNTASYYFCPSLKSLSTILSLSPTITGTTLLPIGNGANDVFESIISFAQSGGVDVGLNTVLGGAFFVSTIVVGVICILISPHQIKVDKPSFIRDVLFFLVSLSSLLFIILFGRINLWGAICFVSIYFVYMFLVSTMHFLSTKKGRIVSSAAIFHEYGEMGIPLLGLVDEEKCVPAEKIQSIDKSAFSYFGLFLYVLELPLYLPRRLTIPAVSEERWSKPFAVISVILTPILLATLWNTQKENMGFKTSLVIYMTAGLVGIILGNFAFVATKESSPPQKCLLPWVVGGFLMSITWIYIVAKELVSLLISLGTIAGISPSSLGLTVLAWGNSTGDLISNVSLAMNGGPDGAQIAISGSYAGPVFNTLVGLGLSLVFASWSEYPSSYVIPRDPSLHETIAFLICGLLWAIVILPKKNMRLNRLLGFGLLAIYFCFLFLKLARALGLLTSTS